MSRFLAEFQYAKGLWVLILSLLAGCSTNQLAYNNADWLMLDRFDDSFDLSDAQGPQLEGQIHRFMDWHRREELPKYAAVIGQWQMFLGDGLTRSELDQMRSHVEAARVRVVEKGVPELAAFLATVTPEQLVYYQQARLARTEDDREKLDWSLEQRQNKRAEEWLDRLDDWLGDLSEAQQEKIRAMVIEMPDFHPAWMAFRELRNQQLIEAIRTGIHQDPDIRAAALEKHLLLRWRDLEASYPDDYRQIRTKVWGAVFVMLLEIDAMLTPVQRRHLLDVLETYRRDARELNEVVMREAVR